VRANLRLVSTAAIIALSWSILKHKKYFLYLKKTLLKAILAINE
jgi:hypothetical protein